MTGDVTLAAVILTRDEARHIQACIETLRFADFVLVLDSCSADDTVALARAAGVRVAQRRFRDYADQRNAALNLLRGEVTHVLFIDADERVPATLAREIRAALRARPDMAGWRIPRHNFIFGRLTRAAGWYPDWQTRLLRIGAARYDPARRVHETVLLDGPAGDLTQPLRHLNYDDLRHFQRKQCVYSALAAEMLAESGQRVRRRDLLARPWQQFRWRFLALRGWREGWHGLRLCALLAWYEYRTWRLAWRRQRAPQGVMGTSRP